MRTDDFDYDLPDSFIAQAPADPRDSCKLMVVKRGQGIEHRIFRDVVDYINPGDLLVVNETRVLPARLLGHKKNTGGACETLLLNRSAGCETCDFEDGVQTWDCLVKPGKRLKSGARIEFEDDDANVILEAEIISIDPANGSRRVRFSAAPTTRLDVDECIHTVGRTPLPPYITSYTGDQEMYQTVYSRTERSAAAPTAGLHFTPELLDAIKAKGADVATVDLEVGLDTFRIVSEQTAEAHEMHTELYTVPQATVDKINETKAHGGRVIAVGTTSVRSLESAAAGGQLEAKERAATKLYILPGYEFKVVDAIITNFHVPRSTLMMLVSAYAGRESIMDAYETAKANNYRFFSFGDAMLLM